MLELIILSLIQGITEFLPISSSAHLIVVSSFFDFKTESLQLDISLHIGSFLAVLIYFRHEIINFIKFKKIFFLIVFASLPVLILGYVFVKYDIIYSFRTLEVIGWTSIIFGCLLYISDKFKNSLNLAENFNFKSSIFIGLLQTLSLIPGVSRAGITITAARFLGYNRVDSAKISFLLSIPTLVAVSFFGIFNLKNENNTLINFNLISIALSFLFSYLTIILFIKFLRNFNLNLFVLYRLFFGIILLYIAYL